MYRVHIQQFEGPLDLLLFFIRRDEVDIYDIPIARIADEYLDYVRVMERVDLDGVGDFVYMAALLIHIKARTLLPKPELDEEGEPIDPRQELVERLLEYLRFKEAAAAMEGELEKRQARYTRGRAGAPEAAAASPADEPLEASLFDLVGALRRVLTEADEPPTHEVEAESYTIEEQQAFVMTRLAAVARVGFVQLVRGRSKPFVVTTFLAVLELARLHRVRLLVDGAATDFHLTPGDEAEAADDAPPGFSGDGYAA